MATDPDRQKSLEVALGAIEKQFGKGAIMRMGEGAKQRVAVIPTGAIGLDVALGVGGFPRGRVCEIFGPESSGKCLVAGTYLWTDRGLETIEELFARVGQPASCTSRTTDVRAHGIRLVNEDGELESMAAVTHNNRRPTLTLTVESGRTVTATHNHPLRVLNERGEIVWRKVAEIEEGDVLVSAAFGAELADPEDGLSCDEASLLGYLVAEGTLGQRHAFTFTNHHDADMVQEYLELLASVLDLPAERVKRYGEGDYRVHDTAVRRVLRDRYGLDFVNADGKSIPHVVRTAGPKAQRAFLSALFEGDGWVEAGPCIALTSASRTLAEQVQLMLLGLGVPCRLSAKENSTYQRTYWTVAITSGAVSRFLSTVGFRSARRAEQVARYVTTPPAERTRWEAVPGLRCLVRDLRDALGGDRELDRLIHDLGRDDLTSAGPIDASRERLAAIVAWADARHVPVASRPLVERLRFLSTCDYTFERVTSVADAGLQPTFDVVVPRTHSFLANGVVSHNTTVALHAIAEAQKQGGIAAFIDAEHALDPTYAAALGVDVEALLVSQPDTGEQALEITDTLVRSGAVDLLVIDSVAALTPRAEIEGEMGDSHVGLQARLMSQALRKLAGHLNRSRTCCIFINQLREKIGVMFGSPETTPGGRALKFYSSVRLDIRRIESLKDGQDFVGNRVRVKVVKNKCVAEGTQIYDPVQGVTRPIEEIVDGGIDDLHVWATDKAGRLHQRRVSALMDQGVQPTVGIRLRNGTTLRLTPDHRVLTEGGWREAGALIAGDRVARPRRAGVFGEAQPFTPDEARLIGYLIGDGYVGGKTPVAFINTEPVLQDDVRSLAEARGCAVKIRDDGIYAQISHRKGEKNGVLQLTRDAGIHGHLAWEKAMPASVLADGVDPDVLANMLFGVWESDGWISREQNGGVRLGFVTTSQQLVWQIHWALLRWGVTSTVTEHEPGSRRSLIDGRRIESKRTAYQLRVSGIDNLERFADALPMWGPKGARLLTELREGSWTAGRRGSRAGYLAAGLYDEIVAHLESIEVSPTMAASMIGLSSNHAQGGYRVVLGHPRVRRDRLQILSERLDDCYLADLLEDDLYFETVREVVESDEARTFDLTVDELHNFVADGVVVHNCAPPFKKVEFDIMFGEGISKEGSLLDMGVEHGIIRKAGAWYTYDGEQLGQGRENARSFLKEHEDVAEEIYKRTAEMLGLVQTDVTGDEMIDLADEQETTNSS